jgi:hypothetical protein
MQSPRCGARAACSVVVLGFVSLAPAAFGQAQPMPSTPELPGYKLLRQDEDWSKFVAKEGGDTFDPVKHMKLGDSSWLSLGARIEAREEVWDGFGFGGTAPNGASRPDSDNFAVSRMLAHADLTVGEHLRAYLEFMTAQCTERDLQGGERTADIDTFEAQQAWFDLKTKLGDDALRLRTGRQSFGFGNQRLLSSLPWANTLNRWDGFTALWNHGGWAINGLLTWYVPVNKTETNTPDDERALYGLYATRAPQPGGTGLDLYVIGNTRPDVAINGTAIGDERRHTLGGRTWGTFGGRGDWEVEGAWQLGEIGDADVSAWFLSGLAGWKVTADPLSPRFYCGIDLASGDRKPGGDVETFHQLYPLGHLYLGYADTVSRQNIAAAHIGASVKPGPSTTVSLTLHTLNLMSDQDAIYQVNGTVARNAPAGGFDSTHIGEELDLLVQHRLYRHLDLYGGYSHVFTGDAVAETGQSDDIDFLYVGMIFTF